MERASEAESIVHKAHGSAQIEVNAEFPEKLPTDKLVDVSPMALRMSSPFNPGYWLAAA